MQKKLTQSGQKISRVSFYFRVLFQLLFILLPIKLILVWLVAPASIFLLGHGSGFVLNAIPKAIEVLHPLALSTKLLGFVISCIPLGIELLLLFFLIKLFRLYEKAEIFSLQNVGYIKKIGYTILIGQFLNSTLYQALLSLTISWGNPHGHRYVSISFTEVNIGLILTSLLIILIAWIMEEGCKLREDQQFTI